MSVEYFRKRKKTPRALYSRRSLVCAAFLVSAGLSSPVSAQENADQDVSPNTSVSERFTQTYGPAGVKAGGFTIFPTLSVAEIYDDNIFSETIDPTDDFVTDIRGGVRVRSNWSVHSLELFSTARRLQYSDNKDESTTDYTYGARGFLDIAARSRAIFRASHRQATESRRATQTAIGGAQPVRFSTTAAAVDFDIRQSRFSEQFGVSYSKDDFEDVDLLAGGGVIDQDFRDREVFSGYFRILYRFRPTIAVFVEVNGEFQNYDFPQLALGAFQDSESYGAAGGVAFDINKVARGEIGLGYQTREYDDPVFSDVSGFNVDAALEYFLSDLTTVTIAVDRSIRDTAVPGVAGFYSTGIDATIEHELLRPVILVGNVQYRRDDFRGIDRNDEVFRLSAGVDYAFRREVVVSFRYIYLDISSSGLAARGAFDENVFRLGLELRV